MVDEAGNVGGGNRLQKAEEQRIHNIQNKIDQLEKTQAAVAKEVADLKNISQNISEVDIKKNKPERPTPEELDAKKKELTKAQLDVLEETINTEASDPEWSYNAETTIDRILQDKQFSGTRLLSLGCRTTLCRVELAFESQEAFDWTMRRLPKAIPWNQKGFFQVNMDQNNQYAGVFYYTREGYDLPKPSTP